MDDLRFADGFVFQHLVAGPVTIGALAERLDVTQQAASKSVADLERRGYVERAAGPGRRARAPGRADRARARRDRGGRRHRAALQAELADGSGRGGSRAPGGCSPTWSRELGADARRARAPRAAAAMRSHRVPLLRGGAAIGLGVIRDPGEGSLQRHISVPRPRWPPHSHSRRRPAPPTGRQAHPRRAIRSSRVGNGGYDVGHYSLDLDYDPATQVSTARRGSR